MHIGLFCTKTGAFSVSVQWSEKSWHPAIHTQGHLVTTATTIIILYQMPTGAWPGVMEMKRSPPKDTEAQRDYCQWSLRGGNKRKVWRREREGEWEGDEKREKEDEKRDLRSRWTLVRPVPLLQGGFLLPNFTSLPPQIEKSLSTTSSSYQYRSFLLFTPISNYSPYLTHRSSNIHISIFVSYPPKPHL